MIGQSLPYATIDNSWKMTVGVSINGLQQDRSSVKALRECFLTRLDALSTIAVRIMIGQSLPYATIDNSWKMTVGVSINGLQQDRSSVKALRECFLTRLDALNTMDASQS